MTCPSLDQLGASWGHTGSPGCKSFPGLSLLPSVTISADSASMVCPAAAVQTNFSHQMFPEAQSPVLRSQPSCASGQCSLTSWPGRPQLDTSPPSLGGTPPRLGRQVFGLSHQSCGSNPLPSEDLWILSAFLVYSCSSSGAKVHNAMFLIYHPSLSIGNTQGKQRHFSVIRISRPISCLEQDLLTCTAVYLANLFYQEDMCYSSDYEIQGQKCLSPPAMILKPPQPCGTVGTGVHGH
ncbi:uncharacterized protein [Symphalangus syndactylus]|uniref:uncharacterized protein n=1 Tax=Symphalangus syndactylus TaxID=9590 RepID=UPI0030060C71